MSKPWTIHEKSWTINEQVMKQSRTGHEQVMYKSRTKHMSNNHEQVIKKFLMSCE